MRWKLTEEGKANVAFYIRELKAKRKEILDAGKDTADETPIPTEEDILSDIDSFIDLNDPDGICYYNGWGVTDNYEADRPLALTFGQDITIVHDDEIPDGMETEVYKHDRHIDLTKIRDSMQLDSDTVLASLEKKGVKAILEVCGEVRVLWSPDGNEENAGVYRRPSAFPEELKKLFAEEKADSDCRVRIEHNNWFEVFILRDGIQEGDSMVANAAGMDWDAVRKLLNEYIN